MFFEKEEGEYKENEEKAVKGANEGSAVFTEAYLRNWYSTHNFKIDANVAMRLTTEFKPFLSLIPLSTTLLISL